jgi:putative FmdB family regulatory protein
MPIYEYTCRHCGRSFEELILRPADEEGLTCPACKRQDVERVLSPTASTPSGPGGRRPPRACGPTG